MTDEHKAFVERQLDFDFGLLYDEHGIVKLPEKFRGVYYSLVDTPEKREAFLRRLREDDTETDES